MSSSRYLEVLAVSAVCATAIPTVLAEFGDRAWILELMTHFRLQYLAAQLLVLGVCLALRHWRTSAALLPLLALNANAVYAYRPSSPPLPLGDASFTVMTANLSSRTTEYTAFIEQASAAAPDVLVLVEFDHDWQESLAGLAADYPHAVLAPRRDNFGIALFTKLPILEQRVFDLRSSKALDARLRLPDGRTMRLIAVHLRPPLNRQLAAERDAQLTVLAELAARIDEPLIITGDFNLTPYSPAFDAFTARAGVRDTRAGRGWGITWPTFLPAAGIPIDHCLVSEHLGAGELRRGRAFGSDHYPILTTLFLRGS
jgi:endonuclease/exonuclease/phosphatase (EEP) superfamily protein YafD